LSERKKISVRDENRHLDVKREVNFRMSALIDRYWTHYGMKKRSASREKSVLDGIRSELGRSFVREIDGDAIGSWYENLTAVRDLSPGTAVRHFNVMHHMMEKASTIWSRETSIDRNPADQVEVRRPDDQRDRYLSEDWSQVPCSISLQISRAVLPVLAMCCRVTSLAFGHPIFEWPRILASS
jgi:hypothetical protein